MLKKLELDSLKADLSAVEALLASRAEHEDPIGWFQFSTRKSELEEEISRLSDSEETHAGVALFFNGRPVFGSKGIRADFAGQAIDKFQDLVSKRFASLESGPLASRGPVPLRENAQMMITDVARGSFGFVLEESNETDPMIATPLKHVVEETAELVFKISSPDEDVFESSVESLDDRLLAALKQFFQLLDDSGATLRIVEGQKEFNLDHEAVRLARDRAETLQISERADQTIIGTVFLLPAARKFELHVQGTGEVLKGNISQDCLKELLGGGTEIPETVVGKLWETRMNVREIYERNRAPKFNYTLTTLVRRL